ncbi:MAG: single-stranded-DNA-specific exonuclease RecJ, partial [Patescibacteria group bacterium]
MIEKNWQLSPALAPKIREQFPELPEVVLQLLFNRGLTTQEKIDEFLNPDYGEDIHDPFLFREMPKAVERIGRAIANDELIIVHGDYDADGVCAAAILISTLKILGAKHLDVFLPDRELEGYGINKNTIEILAAANAKLLISCDCGISNKAEVELANKLGLDVIITDHHTVPKELPPAFAIIHPLMPNENYPDKGLSGGGVAFKLAQALLKNNELGIRNNVSAEKWLLDLVAISTVGDMMPLLGESRTLVKYGLIVLNKTKRLGLRHLIEIARVNKRNGGGQTLDTHNIGFQIAPRLNAAGRMKHANSAYQLLITEDNDEALELARELDHNNQDRQKETAEMLAQANAFVKEEKQENSPAIFILKDNWPIGLIGLVAARLCEQFYRPAIVMTRKDGAIHGSGRSIDEIDIISKIAALKDLFKKFGGHPQACGFTLKDDTLEKFKKEFNKLVGEEVKKKKISPVLSIDAELKLADITWGLYDLLQKFEPFGEANPEPGYLIKNITVVNVMPVGAQGQHLKLTVKQDNSPTHKIIGFCFGDENKVGTNWCA